MTNEERPPLEGATVQLTAPGVPYSAIIVPFSREGVAQGIAMCKYLAQQWEAAFGIDGRGANAAQQRPQQPQQSAPPSNGNQPKTRADQYPVVDGWSCEMCNGPVGRYPKKGGMRSDKAVCLGHCKDGTYIHTVGWLDNEPARQAVAAGHNDDYLEPDALPF